MKKFISQLMAALFSIIMIASIMSSCQKSTAELATPDLNKNSAATLNNAPTPATPNFNLEVILYGAGNAFGLVKFRQDVDAAKVVTLTTWVHDLLPNHEYLLQRAVDTNLDGNCTGTAWLTLGQGLQPQSIITDEKGTANELLFRDLSALPSCATFDIHFQIIDAQNSAVVLTSNCYQYTVR